MASATEFLLTPLLLFAASVAFAQETRDVQQDAVGRAGPPHVTTETLEYCRRLAAEIEERRDPPPAVAMLLAEGIKMCDQGHLAGGLVRLRHAFLLTHPEAGADK